jgi:hypothetical protein
MWSARAHEAKSETHSHKWGKVQGTKPNDFQVHSQFGSYNRVGVVNVQNLGWKGKKKQNWAFMTPLKRS